MERIAIKAARIISQRAYVAPGGLKVTEHFFEVPRDWRSPSQGSIRVFARSAEKHEVPVAPGKTREEEKPMLCYFQGGPGFGCGPPQQTGWVKFFTEKGLKVLLLDGRGTGLSTPVAGASLAKVGNDAEQAGYLKNFRADSIVFDAEAIRLALTAKNGSAGDRDTEHGKPWSVLGQSFGGFCITTYLSLFPESLTEAFLTGGTPPVYAKNPDDVYRRLARRMIARNKAYYGKFPEDVERVKRILRVLKGPDGPQKGALPDGGVLTPERFLAMGISFGFHGGIDSVHDMVLQMNNELDMFGCWTWQTASLASRSMSFDSAPIYAVLHEPLYCQGEASNWSAARILQELPEYDLDRALGADSEQPAYFIGEMVMPSVFRDCAHLREMAGAAEILAQDKHWPALYDLEQLRRNTVPVYAAVYADDVYVDLDLGKQTLNAIGNSKHFLTNMAYHDGLRAKSDAVLDGLWRLRCDVLD